MTLGEWLNRVILEDDVPEEVFSEADFHDRLRRSGEAPRVRLASVGGERARDVPPGDFGRVAQALDRLTDRIEASETRTGLAISSIEHSVRQAVARIETAERESLAVSTRLDGVARRLDAADPRDAAGPRSAEALRAIYREGEGGPAALAEGIAARLSDRLAQAETRTGEALEGLRGALAALDRRLRSVEGGASPEIDRRLDALASELGQRVEAARAEALARLSASSAEGVEARLAEMAGYVRAAEQRSAQAIERMGREVLSLAEAMNRRLAAAEQQGAQAIEQVGGEIARIGHVVESRLSRAEQAQAEALEKLGAEIGRVTDRLTERVVQSERRAAQAIQDVGEQVARVTERIEHRHERLSGDLAEQIRESEARTARLLEESRGGLEASLAGASEQLSAAAADEDDPPPVHPFGPELFARAEIAPPDMLDEPPPRAAEAIIDIVADDFTPLAEPPEDAFLEDAEAGVEEKSPLSTREVIEQARLAARTEQAGAAAQQTTSKPAAERRPEHRAGARRVFGGLGFRTTARPPTTWQTALMLAGGAAFLSVGAAGVVLMESPSAKAPSTEIAAAPVPGPEPRAAVALAPQPLGPTAPAPGDMAETPEAAPAPQPAADYAAAVRDVEAGQPGGLARLKRVAETGYAPAQFYLAKLYENGVSGVVKNPAEARKWTERAAEGGDRSAMHNLALYEFRGEGGPQDLAAAASWFRKAAEAGVVDSQYNLALLYESGSGVGRDLSQAYKWFSIAAQGGDAQARANAVDLESKLTATQLAAADKAVAAFQPKNEIAAQASNAGAASLATVQHILGRLGYYAGPMNGAPSKDLSVAVLAYQKDHGLAATGTLDPNTLSQLSVFSR